MNVALGCLATLLIVAGFRWLVMPGDAAPFVGHVLFASTLAAFSVAMWVEWRDIIVYARLPAISLATVERTHPRLTRKYEPLLAGLLTVACLFLVALGVSKAFAFSFTESGTSFGNTYTQDVLIGDMNNDGFVDFVATDSSGQKVLVYSGDGTGNFTLATQIPLLLYYPILRDVNGDGNLDIVGSDGDGQTVRVYKNNYPATGFSLLTSFDSISGTPTAPPPLILFDADLDGDEDILVAPYGSQSNNLFLNDGGGSFTAIGNPLPANILGVSSEAADFTSDGREDIVLFTASPHKIRMLRNDGNGNFAQLASFDLTVSSGNFYTTVADIDGDGDLDVILAEKTSQKVRYFANDGFGGFNELTDNTLSAEITGISAADLDNDGDVDMLVGHSDTAAPYDNGGFSSLANDGHGAFSAGPQQYNTYCVRATALADGDNDGDLDLMTGTIECSSASSAPIRYFASDVAATTPNTPPSAPQSDITVTAADPASGLVRFAWGSGSDVETPTRMLQYSLRIGTSPGADDVVSRAASPSKPTRTVPNGQSRSALVTGLACSTTYYWSIATIDGAFRRTWSSEFRVALDGSCNIRTVHETGGGSLWNMSEVRDAEERVDSDAVLSHVLTMTVAEDLNGNGMQDNRESPLMLPGLAFHIEGHTADGTDVDINAALGADGTAEARVATSNGSGYSVTLIGTDPVESGYAMTTPATLTGIVIVPLSKDVHLFFGLRRSELLAYSPCLHVGPASTDEQRGSDAMVLMQRLRNSFGNRIDRGVGFSGSLVSRRQFFTLLQRTQCIELLTTKSDLHAARPDAPGLPFEFIDLPINPAIADSSVMYSLLPVGIDVTRPTTIGPAADLRSPISRQEAFAAVAKILPIPATSTGSREPNPRQSKSLASQTGAFQGLRELGILPAGLSVDTSLQQGLTPAEASLIILKAAFRNGKIALLPDLFAQTTPPWPNGDAAAILQRLPALPLRSCLEQDQRRQSDVEFADIFPGDAAEPLVRAALAYGTRDAAGRMLWLVPATRRPTEYGVAQGQTRFLPNEPITMLETLRALLVLSCLPPETAVEAAIPLASKPVVQGSSETRVARDRISDLPRDTSFASRVLYRAQDHQQEYDLSLFTYAPTSLRKVVRPPADPFSVAEASDILASGILGIAVRNRLLSPQDAQNLAAEFAAALTNDFSDGEPETNGTKPFTRAMLLQGLSLVFRSRERAADTPSEDSTS